MFFLIFISPPSSCGLSFPGPCLLSLPFLKSQVFRLPIFYLVCQYVIFLTFEYVLNPVCCADEALSDYKKVLELDPTQLEANRAVRRLPQKVMFIYVIIYYALRISMYPLEISEKLLNSTRGKENLLQKRKKYLSSFLNLNFSSEIILVPSHLNPVSASGSRSLINKHMRICGSGYRRENIHTKKKTIFGLNLLISCVDMKKLLKPFKII